MRATLKANYEKEGLNFTQSDGTAFPPNRPITEMEGWQAKDKKKNALMAPAADAEVPRRLRRARRLAKPVEAHGLSGAQRLLLRVFYRAVLTLFYFHFLSMVSDSKNIRTSSASKLFSGPCANSRRMFFPSLSKKRNRAKLTWRVFFLVSIR
jgi:hypothetical protein